MTRHDYRPGAGPARGLVIALLLATAAYAAICLLAQGAADDGRRPTPTPGPTHEEMP